MHESQIATTPSPPYYAAIFTSIRTEGDHGYADMAQRMLELVTKQQGFLGMESAREALGISVSYWKDKESIQRWKENAEHALAREKGRRVWYKSFKVRITLVERDYQFLPIWIHP